MQQVAFAHRRFQEYFATRVVLKDLHAVPPRVLLKDARWRETAVTIFQTQSTTTVRLIIESAVRMLDYHFKALSHHVDGHENSSDKVWLPGLLHLLRILDAGIIAHSGAVDRVRHRVDSILKITLRRGVLTDQKWSIDVAGAASERFRLELFRHAFKGESQWLRTAAYRQLGRLHELPTDIADAVRKTLISMMQGGELRRERLGVDAQLRRLSQPRQFLQCLRLLLWMPVVDFILILAAGIAVSSRTDTLSSNLPAGGIWIYLALLGSALIAHAGFYILRAGPMFAWPSASRLRLRDWPSISRLRLFAWTRALSFRLIRFFGWEPNPQLRQRNSMIFSAWYAYFALRVLPFIFILPLEIVGDDFASSATVIGYMLYVMLWAPGAMVAVRRGRLLEAWWWLLYPGLLLYWSLVALMKFCTKFFGERSLKAATILLARRSLYLLMLAILLVAEFWIINLGSEGSSVISPFIVFVLGTFWLWLLGVFGVMLYRRVSDHKILRRWTNTTTVISAQELAGNLPHLSTTKGRVKYLRMLRRRQALLPDDATVTALMDMLKNQHSAHEVRDEIAQLTEELINAEYGKAGNVQEDRMRGM